MMSFGKESLGREYDDQEVICHQGEAGDRMFVLQTGRAVVIREDEGTDTVIDTLEKGDVFGEMAIFDKQPRSATVRAQGKARVLTLDKRTFLKRVHEDPSLAFQVLRKMSLRIRSLHQQIDALSRE
ncbi:cyclic nucleotide-binding domain-containing protein [Gemmatimonadota bacterium]